MTRIGVLGAGSWGTVLADLLARKGHAVRIWAREADVVASINGQRENELFLPGHALAPSLVAEGDAARVVTGADVVVSASPSHAVRQVIGEVAGAIGTGALVVSATKGIEDASLARMSEVIGSVIPGARVAVLSGPSFASEVAAGQPTAVVAASLDATAAAQVQELFSTPVFRVYTNRDVIGVELGGSLKNVIAIAAGTLEGLGLGHNPRAALLTRGLAEITRLGVALGAEAATFAGLAGMGDLILTATGALSRNRALGIALAHGESFEAWQARNRTVAEGANTSRAAARLAQRAGVEMPIADEVLAVLFEGKPARDSVRDLMERELKAEQW
ncbi:MAG TPA: NAD(P)H-dependent glycerol-3-phosphate dehydrogenase [Gemmatimonadales bacterium]|jgi:glycerol-3-phosphate dehydrogenase (NAD(P)+)|nr:NAD(P)H-dependent glycerol-3-phosphate dehydrogenase [Gemmatimonadales bacterium]